MTLPIDLAAIEDAREVIDGRVHRTPVLSSRAAAAVVERATGAKVADGTLYLKAEHLQKTGSFKPRGMTNKAATLTADERRRGIITYSSGNHAQAVAMAARFFDIKATVVMPEGAPQVKIDRTMELGAKVILAGTTSFGTFFATDPEYFSASRCGGSNGPCADLKPTISAKGSARCCLMNSSA